MKSAIVGDGAFPNVNEANSEGPASGAAANLGLDLESHFLLFHGPAPRLLVIAPVNFH